MDERNQKIMLLIIEITIYKILLEVKEYSDYENINGKVKQESVNILQEFLKINNEI